MADIIQQMLKSDNDLLKAQGKYASLFKNLKHNKESLEEFLNSNIARLRFLASDKKMHEIICTSNTTLIKMLQLVKENDLSKASKLHSNGIHTKYLDSIDTWDIIENKLKRIKLKQWSIDIVSGDKLGFLTIAEDNILHLHQLINDVLKR